MMKKLQFDVNEPDPSSNTGDWHNGSVLITAWCVLETGLPIWLFLRQWL